ncbi:TPA: hypothetical protein L4623_005419 [Pseudomonas aeruginosa]|uniref:Uncharacterized protein n=2 Tax=Pseudomonadaceae TaxID=135621 RepID=A0A6H1Q8Z3_PSEAI|nr:MULTISPECIES: hypothetical protein [Pseudomonadaceae]EKB4876895.1 hypothetical protein [Pseudomonas aeruginosa]EKE7662480.1 hypothetical protein [Pseudomonas aeruginosa]EKK5028477.1 hypothetical protein [Pseudomonas aeruginosa]EKV0256490.1 hypothetical protein [Pseudomonas aeruginosa]EKV3062519.1 hypothetical protein [Pseudomonas aeruginosa]
MSFMRRAAASMGLILMAASVSVGAEPSLVEFTVQGEGVNSRVTTEVGTPTPISQSQNEHSSTCELGRENPPVIASLDLQASDSVHILLFPIERSTGGVKTLISISKTAAKSPQLVEISTGCKVLLGATSSVSVTEIRDLKWQEVESLKFSDGSVATIVATDPKAAAD